MSAHTAASFTPGPWRAIRDEVWVGKSRRVCPRVTSGDSLPIGVDMERAKANARLISAAPDLLTCLKDWVASFADSIEGGEADELVKFTRAAIAKAEGAQS